MAPTHQDDNQGPLSEEAQMRVKYGATKGGLARSDGDRPEPSEDDVHARGGLSKEAQERIVEGGRRGGQARAAQMGREGYQEMGRKGGLATKEKSGEEAAREKGIEIAEAKYKTIGVVRRCQVITGMDPLVHCSYVQVARDVSYL